MPIYEYRCPACNGQFQKLVRGFSDPEGLACPRCGNSNIQRAVSRFATIKSEEARLEAIADPSSLAGLDESDPRAIARWAKKLGKELGEDAGEDWDEMVDQMLEEELDGKAEEGGPGAAPAKPDNLGWA
ncbi:FmdB family zinc ribbon protein [Candidatus Viridilinea mediisalina]|uniref:FmdB family transcriptional regulator n=1 Tax=Candidatus Viridilinea mediisalina TaxID=2024553 RepID=A0A2A6RIX8_9CHLR|nr:zinc ribbon domain-containing protein [Candidatus Viridilinea mediisalina]PDW02818.1 FmdB family transcriptional regulator [Candidatus Viridilinea mediisalina]